MEITSELIMAMAFGSTPVQEVIRQGEEMLEHIEDRVVVATLLSILRLMYAWLGEFDHARNLGESAEAICRDLGQHVLLAWWSEEAALVEVAAGDFTSAEEKLRDGCDALGRMGENASLSTKAALLADILFSAGRYVEAEEYVALSERAADPDDIASQARIRAVKSKIMATRGKTAETIALAQEAVSLADTSDDLDLRGETWLSARGGAKASRANTRGHSVC
jgi:tetratricopeptide (TPR) repeat protein